MSSNRLFHENTDLDHIFFCQTTRGKADTSFNENTFQECIIELTVTTRYECCNDGIREDILRHLNIDVRKCVVYLSKAIAPPFLERAFDVRFDEIEDLAFEMDWGQLRWLLCWFCLCIMNCTRRYLDSGGGGGF